MTGVVVHGGTQNGSNFSCRNKLRSITSPFWSWLVQHWVHSGKVSSFMSGVTIKRQSMQLQHVPTPASCTCCNACFSWRYPFNFNCQLVIFQELITLQQISCPANNYLSSSLIQVLSHLDSTVQSFRFKGLASSTHQLYQAGSNHFCRFCMEHNVDPFPVPESLLCYFVASLG